MVRRMVRPSLLSSCMYFQRFWRSSTSTPAVGSSRISSLGLWTRARATMRRRFMPPERARVLACFFSWRLSFSRISSIYDWLFLTP